MIIPLTLERAPQRLKVLRFIQAEVGAGRPFPTYEAIRDHMGWKNQASAQQVCSTLYALDRVLKREWNGKRSNYSLKDIIG